MPVKLRLTGRASFMHPLTYGTRLKLNQIALFSDQDGAVLQPLMNRDADPDVSVFTVLAGAEPTNFDFSGFRGGASPLSRLTPRLWSARPSANAVAAGTEMPVLGIGLGGRSIWVSDGIENWHPLNGSVVAYQNPSANFSFPVNVLTGDGTRKFFTLGTPCLLPAGMLFRGMVVEVGMFARKNGTHTGGFLIGMATAAGGAGYQAMVSAGTAAAAGTYFRATSEASVYSIGFNSTGNASVYGQAGASTSSVPADRADANITTQDRYIVFGIETSYTDSAAELIQYFVRLRG